MNRLALLLAGALLATGCWNLDGFLFSTRTTPAYEFPKDDDAAATRELVSFKTEDGIELWGLWMPAAKRPATGCKTALLYCHGNNTNLTTAYERTKKFRDLGYDIFVFDYRGYGKSAGTPTEDGLYADGRAALAELKRHSGDADIAYYGYSLGAAVCTQLATEVHPLALHLDSPFASIDKMARDNGDLPLPGAAIATWKFDNEGKVNRIGAPFQLFHGDSDDYLRPAHGQAVFDAALQPKQIWLAPGANHDTVPWTPGFDALLVSFLEQPDPAHPRACAARP